MNLSNGIHMNQQTKQLLEAAGFQYIPHDGIGWAGNHNSSLPKLVELIVRECIVIVSAGISNATDWDSSYWDQACENRAQAIKQHFGVEL